MEMWKSSEVAQNNEIKRTYDGDEPLSGHTTIQGFFIGYPVNCSCTESRRGVIYTSS
jgi:hypothetical protein